MRATIKNIKISDEGRYECRLQTPHKDVIHTQDFRLKVYSKYTKCQRGCKIVVFPNADIPSKQKLLTPLHYVSRHDKY